MKQLEAEKQQQEAEKLAAAHGQISSEQASE
jgi:hypothetical protein